MLMWTRRPSFETVRRATRADLGSLPFPVKPPQTGSFRLSEFDDIQDIRFSSFLSYPNILMPSMYPNNPRMSIKIDYAGTSPGNFGPPVGQQERSGWHGARPTPFGANDGMRDIGMYTV